MKKTLINTVIVILVGIFIMLSILVIINFTKLGQDFKGGTGFNKDNPPVYKFMVIVDGSDPNYVKKLKVGMTKAAKESFIVYEMWPFEGKGKEEDILRQFDIAVESNVDGIIIQAFGDERFDKILSKASSRKIPVITIKEDIPTKEKVSCVSFNQYLVGTKIGELLNNHFEKLGKEEGTVVMLENDIFSSEDKGLAIKEKLKDTFTVKPEKMTYQGENKLNAEGLTRHIISRYNDLTAIICSSGEETLGVIEALKDANKINDVVVIGNDDYGEILNYIKKGVLFATVVADNEKLGYEAIVDMVLYKNGLFVSQYKDITVKMITKNNVDYYLKKVGEK